MSMVKRGFRFIAAGMVAILLLSTLTMGGTVSALSGSNSPILNYTTPLHENSKVSLTTDFYMYYDENIYPDDEGYIQLWKSADHSLVWNIGSTDEEVVITDNLVKISPSFQLEYNTEYYVTTSFAFKNAEAIYAEDFAIDNNMWKFTTIPEPLEANSFNPVSGAVDVAINTHFTIEFNQEVKGESGESAIMIYKKSDPLAPILIIEPGDESFVTVSGSTATISPGITLEKNTEYYIVVVNAFINEQSQEYYVGFMDDRWSFTTGDEEELPLVPPVVQSPVVGDGQATISWESVLEATGYKVYKSSTSGTYTAEESTVTASVYTFTGLTNNSTYYFTVKATNANGDSEASNEVSATPVKPNAPIQTPTTSSPTNTTGVDVLVNGKIESAGTATTANVNGQTVTTITIDPQKLDDRIAAEGQNAVITIPVKSGSDVVIGELNGQMLQNLERNSATVVLQTDNSTYKLPAQLINIQSISDQIGSTVALSDIQIQIEIATPSDATLKLVESSAVQGDFAIVIPALNFTVRATYGDKTVEVTNFDAYVERTIRIPDGVDPAKITTGVVVEPDGTVRHVPTKVVLIDGNYYAVVNSLTNSTYSIVWHPLAFKDVETHWAKDAVNDMGSRMVISGIDNELFNPDEDITRAEFAAIVVRGLGLKLGDGETSFSDVSALEWYSSAIQTAYAYNLISGFEDGTFRPQDQITREEAMVIIAQAMNITGLISEQSNTELEKLLSPFSDADHASDWAKSSIAANIQAGIVSGRNNTQLDPKANITRAEVAVIISRLLQKSKLI